MFLSTKPGLNVDDATAQTAEPACHDKPSHSDAQVRAQVLRDVWLHVLNVADLADDDDFFMLGGDSLLVTQMLGLLRAQGWTAPLKSLMQKPVFAEMHAQLVPYKKTRSRRGISDDFGADKPRDFGISKADADHIAQTVPGGIDNIQDIYGLLPMQVAFLFQNQRTPQSDPYVVIDQFHCVDRNTLDQLVRAYEAAIARHDILRSIVCAETSTPLQAVLKKVTFPVVELPAYETPADIRARLTSEPMTLETGPLLRAYTAPQGDGWALFVLKHHIIGDHVSFDLLHDEIAADMGLPSPSPTKTIPFRHAVRAFDQCLADGTPQTQTPLTETEAPFGLTNAALGTDPLSTHELTIDPVLYLRLKTRAQALGVSLASLCHIAWGMVLSRASGGDTVTTGSVFLGRANLSLDQQTVMGPMINTQPVTMVIDDTPVDAALRGIHQQLTGMLAHEHLPSATSELSHTDNMPFATLLNFRHSTALRDTRALGYHHVLEDERATFPLTCSIDDFGTSLMLTVQVHADQDASQIAFMLLTAFEKLSIALEQSPESPIGMIDVLPSEEHAKIIHDWNQTVTDFPSDQSIHSLFQAHAQTTPDALAIQDGSTSINYATLDQWSDNLGAWLQHSGVSMGDHVVLQIKSKADLVAMQLAVSKVGAVFVPLAHDLPADRTETITQRCDAICRVTDALFDAPEPSCRVLDLSDAPNPHDAGSDFTAVTGSGEATAYVMFTSGSTGTPKGVCVPHRAIARLAVGNKDLPVEAHNRFGFAANPSFDASTYEIWGPLLNGAALVALETDALFTPTKLLTKVEQTGIDTLWLTAGLFNQLEPDLHDVFDRLSTLVIGGDVADRGAVCRVAHQHPHLRFLNGYGPTEMTTFSTVHRIMPDVDPNRPVPIGRPMSNTRAYVLDARMRPVPIGAIGELYLAGPGIAHGYLGQPDLTDRSFLADPFSADKSDRMYRTGDLVRWQRDGCLHYIGRKDSQVKIRGFRIELEDVRVAVLRNDMLADAVVIAAGDTADDRHLVAYVVPKQDVEVHAAELKRSFQAHLPGFMTPQSVVVLDQLPLTATGKVDRRALPAPESIARSEDAGGAPEGTTETKLVQILSGLLKNADIRRDDNLFDLGLHSLLILKVLSGIRTAFGQDMSPGDVYAAPTLAALAARIDANDTPADSDVLERIIPVVGAGQNRPSPTQERLWFLSQLKGNNAAYVIPTATMLTGALDRSALERALQNLFARHAALRSVFSDQDGQPIVSFLSVDTPIRLPIRDLRDVTDPDTHAKTIVAAEWDTPFDLENGPLIRAQLLQLADDRHLFVLTLHHIIADGWSIDVITRDFSTLYQHALGLHDPLAPLDITFQDAAEWQRTRLSGELRARQSSYWADALNGADMSPALPVDTPRPIVQDLTAGSIPISLSAETTAQLERLARSNGTTLFTVLLTAWSLVLSRLSGRQDLLIAIPTANRDHPDVAPLVGYFANTLAIRITKSSDDDVASLLRKVHHKLQCGQSNQDLPWDEVVDVIGPARDTAHLPICQVLFGWQANADPVLNLTGLDRATVNVPPKKVKFEQHLDLARTDTGIEGALNYAIALFEPETAQRHADYLTTVLDQIVQAVEGEPVELIDMMPAPERAALTAPPRLSAASEKTPLTMCEMLDRQAAQSPDRIAVRDDTHACTYAELAHRTDRLAEALARHVSPKNPTVGIAMERGLDMVTVVVACAKAGIAYVPMAPDLPAARLERMCTTADPQVILCDAKGMRATAHLMPKSLPIEKSQTGVPTLPDAPDPQWDAPIVQSGESTAYVLFTSGSTGTPKGVCVPQRALINHLTWIDHQYRMTETDVVIQKTPLSFDVSVWEIFWPLTSGGTVAVMPHDTHKDPHAIRDFITAHDVTIAHFVPSMMNAFLTAMDRHPVVPLRQVFMGGEPVTGALVTSVQQCLPQAQVTNFYGPSECTIEATFWDAPAKYDGKDAPIGTPITNMSAYVLDAHRRPVPRGSTGELYLMGRGVADGYKNQPELTEERFVTAPFAPHMRMYRTGDLVRQRTDGQLVFVGRQDGQTKLRGYRVELSEITQVLVSHAAIADAAVTIDQTTKDLERVVAHIVWDQNAAHDLQAVRQFVLEHLPDYMAPTAFVRHAELPRTVSGKIDLRALPAPRAQDDCRAVFDAPKTPTERQLATVWTGLLGVAQIGRHDNFFDLGGNSLMAVRVVDQARKSNLPLALADLVAHPVLSLLAAHLDRLRTLADNGTDAPNTTYSPWAPLTTSGPETPTVFVFPGAGMSSTCFRHFAAHAEGKFAVIGLDPPGLIPGQTPLNTIEEAAEIFADAITSAAPAGKVHLIGHSFGAITAFATAQLLAERAFDVCSLSLFDPPNPHWGHDTHSLQTLHNDFADGLGDALSCRPTPAVRAAARQDTPSFITAVSAWLVTHGTLPEGLDTPILSSRFNTYKAARQSGFRSKASYPACTHLFLSDALDHQAHVAGWTQYLESITVSSISASHHGMLLPPSVATLFRLWRDIRIAPNHARHLH